MAPAAITGRGCLQATPSYRSNYVRAALEGGFFMGGIAFLSMESVTPAMIHELGGPKWAVSLAPVLFMIGFGWPQLISALWVERLEAMKPFCLKLGFVQRLFYGFTGLFLFFLGREHPGLAVALAFLTPLVSSSLGGVFGSAYMELITRMIPVQRLASLWAIRNILVAGFGITAGFIINWVLAGYPGARGYGILHLLAFGMMMISWLFFTTLREGEIPARPTTRHITLKSGMEGIRERLRDNPSLGLFILTRILFTFIFVAIPFLSVRAIEVTGRQSSLLGMLVIPQMIGMVAGNIFTGYLGDRQGVRYPMLSGRAVLLVAVLAALPAREAWHFMAVFCLLGFGLSSALAGDATMLIDFAPGRNRKFFFGVNGTLIVPAMLAAAGLSAVLQYVAGGFILACLTSAAALGLSLYFLVKLRDPRHGFPPPGERPPAGGGPATGSP